MEEGTIGRGGKRRDKTTIEGKELRGTDSQRKMRKGKRVKDEEPDQSYLDEESDQSLSLKTEPEPGPGQTLAQVLDRSEGIETGTVVYLTPRHLDYN